MISCDLTVMSVYDPDEHSMREDCDFIADYAEHHQVDVQWIIVVEHPHAGRVVDLTRPTSRLALVVLTVDDMKTTTKGHHLNHVRGKTTTTITDLMALDSLHPMAS